MRPLVETSWGKLRGVEDDGIMVFRGIPFAAPPVGDLRWRPPQPAETWSGEKDASEFGASAPQDVLAKTYGFTAEAVMEKIAKAKF